MGFGHLRAAHNILGLGNASLARVDRAPNVSTLDRFVWNSSLYFHTYGSRDAESRNRILYEWFERLMRIPEDHESPPLTESRFIRRLSQLGIGRLFFESLDGALPTLLHTFYLHAMLSVYRDYQGKNYLLLCDTDFHRVWVPVNPTRGSLQYMVPITKSADRLISYGVPPRRIHVTGFPLPVANTGGPDLVNLRDDFDARRARLKSNSDTPLTVLFPFSGAGAYSNLLSELVMSMLDEVREGEVHLVVSCGDNEHALRSAGKLFRDCGLGDSEFAEILFDGDLFASFDRFNQVLKSTDVIITKPSEMVFYAALGIPMLFLPPIGAHEAKNRDYLISSNCAVNLVNLKDFPKWLKKERREGRLLELAETGMERLPKHGTFAIDELVRSP